jgi:uncharacterized membrane protein
MRQPRVYLNAVLFPPQSLSRRGAAWFMAAMAVIAGVSGVAFLMAGAYPVTGFLGLELLLLWAALRYDDRRRSARTFVRVTRTHVDVRRRSADGAERTFRVSPHALRVIHEDPAAGASRLLISAEGQMCDIGEHLTAEEKAAFARRLRRALADARAISAPEEGP